MRSARAVSRNGLPSASGNAISPLAFDQMRSIAAAVPRSKSRTKSIAFSMPGQFTPSKAGSSSSAAKRARARRTSVARASGGSAPEG